MMAKTRPTGQVSSAAMTLVLPFGVAAITSYAAAAEAGK
jgi:hypothetical protein